MVGTKAIGSIEKFWPMADDPKPKKVQPMSKEEYDDLIYRHKIKVK
jgi:hypothetical protein